MAAAFVNSVFFKCKSLSDDRRLYLHDRKWNLRSDVDGLTHTKQLLNLLFIVYIYISFQDVDLETFQSMMSEDGVMTLQADIKGAENIQERPIEIKFELKKDKDDNK